MQDIDAINDKSKEASKALKHLTKLFPNKVTLQAPQVCYLEVLPKGWLILSIFWHLLWIYVGQMLQDEMELSRWNEMLNRDIEVLKGNANISKIRSVSICAKTNCLFKQFVHYIFINIYEFE